MVIVFGFSTKGWNFLEEYVLDKPADIQEEINELVVIEQDELPLSEGSDSEDFESIQDIITKFRFSDIQKSDVPETEDINSYVVKVNVLHLENNSFALVGRNGSIHHLPPVRLNLTHIV